MFSVSDEKTVLLLLKKGSVEAFELLYNKHKATTLANICKLVKDIDIAADILQDVFITVWQCREKIDANQSFRGFLFSIAKNKVYDFFRMTARDVVLQDRLIKSYQEHEYPLIDKDLVLTEDVKALKDAIEDLPQKCREVFKLCKIEGKSYEEVSKKLNISTATINNHIVKATRILKHRFANFQLICFFFTFF